MSDTETKTVEPISVLTWGVKGAADYIETPVQDVPTSNMSILCLRGFRHVLGNEVAAKVTAWKKTDDGKSAGEDEVASKAREFRAEFLDRILNGQLGQRAAGAPRATGVDALKRAIALEFLKAMLDSVSKKTGNKVTVPTGDNTITIAGKAMTREQLIEATMRKRAADIEAEVARRQAVRDEGADVGEDIFGED